jgi:hypothetical protein
MRKSHVQHEQKTRWSGKGDPDDPRMALTVLSSQYLAVL